MTAWLKRDLIKTKNVCLTILPLPPASLPRATEESLGATYHAGRLLEGTRRGWRSGRGRSDNGPRRPAKKEGQRMEGSRRGVGFQGERKKAWEKGVGSSSLPSDPWPGLFVPAQHWAKWWFCQGLLAEWPPRWQTRCIPSVCVMGESEAAECVYEADNFSVCRFSLLVFHITQYLAEYHF